MLIKLKKNKMSYSFHLVDFDWYQSIESYSKCGLFKPYIGTNSNGNKFKQEY
jgi:hypothetical protein